MHVRTAALESPEGYPEEHVVPLAANRSLAAEVADRVSEGMPVHGECAGLLYLGASLAGREGPEHPMAGALPLTGRVGPRLTLGYRDAVALTDSVLYRVGERVADRESFV